MDSHNAALAEEPLDESDDDDDISSWEEAYQVISFSVHTFLSKFKFLSCVITSLLLSQAFLTAWQPQLLQQILDSIQSDSHNLYTLMIQLALCDVGADVLKQTGRNWGQYLSHKVEEEIIEKTLLHSFSLPMKWHCDHDSGEIQNVLETGATAAIDLVNEFLKEGMLIEVVQFLMILFFALRTAPSFALVFLLPIPCYWICSLYFDKKEDQPIKESRKQEKYSIHPSLLTFRLCNSRLFDGLSNVLSVKVFGNELQETRSYMEKLRSYRNVCYSIEVNSSYRFTLQNCICITARLFLIGQCIQSIIDGKMTLGTVVMLLEYQQSTLNPIDYFSYMYLNAKRDIKKLVDLVEILKTANPMEDSELAKDLGQLQSGITLDHVTFEIGQRETLSDISLEILAGKTTALVGRSGSGKSTLGLLLLRLYDPSKGSILWDNTDLRHSTSKSRAHHITMVPQDNSLFNRTIRENIAYGNPDASMEQIIEAAKKANAHDFIMKTPQQYDTVIGERGTKLSGGQKQRIAIARCLILKPSLLLLDESTSHLDSESETQIQEAIQNLQHCVTQVIIAHRLSTIVHADNIVVLDEGKVVAQGKHEVLLKECSLYRSLYEMQNNTSQ